MEQDPDNRQTKKVSLTVYMLSLIVVLIVGIAGTILFVKSTDSNQEAKKLENPSTEGVVASDSNLKQVEELYTVLSENYFEEVDSDDLVEGALEGMAGALDDPYTQYLDVSESTSLQENTNGEFEGIGAEVMKEGEYVRIVSPIGGSPAETAGLQANDLIVEIDGESVAELSLTDAVALIRGPKDSEVTLLLQRNGEEFNVTLTRDAIPVESVIYELDEDQLEIGYVRITNFNRPTYQELVDAIEDLKSQGAEKFVFDVRSNPGGLLDSALQISNIFVEDGLPLMQSQGRGEEPYVYQADSENLGDYKYDGKAVLLTNEGSASASEILAGALSESADIPLIGQTTFGKGTIQNVVPLEDGDGEVKFTTGKWLTADGEWIHEKGIAPDAEVAMPDYQNLLIVNSEETYQLGDSSDEVKNLNAVLDALGYGTSESESDFTEDTKSAVESYQSDKDLEVNGIVTGSTATNLVEDLRTLIEENDTQYKEAIKVLNEQ
ncbi:S41 family peptidase [Marinilactibacillus kalidii]|uniref:S41 family peptidase n=1 Tax=Marinilactibacillus kalidii TaxID=2820274 RepID=UPI001ABE1EEE|nr:S41 family peptidase [Marinilactibacillus kalidii]